MVADKIFFMKTATTAPKKTTTKVAQSKKATAQKAKAKAPAKVVKEASLTKAQKAQLAKADAEKAKQEMRKKVSDMLHSPTIQKKFNIDHAIEQMAQVSNFKLESFDATIVLAQEIAKARNWFDSKAGKSALAKRIGTAKQATQWKHFAPVAFPWSYRTVQELYNVALLPKAFVTKYRNEKALELDATGSISTIGRVDLLMKHRAKTPKATEKGATTKKELKAQVHFHFIAGDGTKVGINAYTEEYEVGSTKTDVTTLKTIGGEQASRIEILHALELLAERIRQDIAEYPLEDTLNIVTPDASSDSFVAEKRTIAPLLKLAKVSK